MNIQRFLPITIQHSTICLDCGKRTGFKIYLGDKSIWGWVQYFLGIGIPGEIRKVEKLYKKYK